MHVSSRRLVFACALLGSPLHLACTGAGQGASLTSDAGADGATDGSGDPDPGGPGPNGDGAAPPPAREAAAPVDGAAEVDAGASPAADGGTGDADAAPADGDCLVGGADTSAVQDALGDPDCARVLLPAGTVAGPLVIERSLTISGAGRGDTVIDGGGTSRVLAAEGNIDVVIEDLTVSGGAAEQGAGLSLEEGRFTLRRVDIEDNQLSGEEAWYGAGVYAAEVEMLRFEDVRIAGNSADASEEDSAVGIGLYATHSDVYLDGDTVITGNTVRTADGAGSLRMVSGGGAHVQHGSLVVDGAEVSGNVIDLAPAIDGLLSARGAGINCRHSTLELRPGTEIRDNAISLEKDGPTGSVQAEGAGIYSLGCTVTAEETLVSGNTITVTATSSASSQTTGGGGVAASGGELDFKRVLVEENAASVTLAGFSSTTTVDGGGIKASNTQLLLDGCAVRDNLLTSVATSGAAASAMGGGLRARTPNGQTFEGRVVGTTISGNVATVTGGERRMQARGGGISASGASNNSSFTLSLINSTVSGNHLEMGDTGTGDQIARGAAVLLSGPAEDNPAHLELRNVTITNNVVPALPNPVSGASYQVGGLMVSGENATVAVSHSILHGNSAAGDDDCSAVLGAAVTSLGHNFLGVGCAFAEASDSSADPGLGPLADNGGPTETHALLPGSPAIDAGHPDGCEDDRGEPIEVDQRREPRGAVCDVGAYEAAP